ncbi:MAG: biotin/lipoyl-binding protein [Desulfobacteraceae bacterium]|nr:MAG: biotin/lipoyl-binding protein [Desulfobacteraceae bacterium]
MKKYIVRVNGKSYEVEVEEVKSGGAAGRAVVGKPAGTPQPAPAQPAPPPQTSPSPVRVGIPSGRITAPMTGTILRLDIQPGASVKRGDILLTLEAMKMENEVYSPTDGRVAVVHVSVGDSVEIGNPLVDLE